MTFSTTFLQKVERGLKDGEAGRTFTQEEVGKRMSESFVK